MPSRLLTIMKTVPTRLNEITGFALAILIGCSGGEVDIGDNVRTGVDFRTAVVIGNACIPSDELYPEFGGYELDTINLETSSAACSSGLCLSYHHRGRVSCPYGQTEEDLSLPADHPQRCRVPRTEMSEVVPVEVAVPPSFADRPPEDAAYCTCQCGGPNADCICPEGFACQEVFEDVGFDVPRHLCIKAGTAYDSTTPPQVPCRPGAAQGQSGYCGHNGYNP